MNKPVFVTEIELQNLLVVFSNPVDNREADFNDWYTNVHIRDVMRMPTSIAVQRFVLAAEQPDSSRLPEYRYLAVYEIGDTVQCTLAHGAAMTPKLPVSTAFDLASPAHYFRLKAFIRPRPLVDEEGDVVLALFDDPFQFQLAPAAKCAGTNGCTSVAHLEVAGDQLIPTPAAHRQLALFRSSAEQAFTASFALGDVVSDAPVVARYRPITARLTAHAVSTADLAATRVEESARAALGDRQYRSVFTPGGYAPE